MSFASSANAVDSDDFQQTMILADATRQNFKEAKQKYKNMTPAQRKTFNTEVKKKWDNLPAADKENFKTMMKENVEVLKLKAQNKNKKADDETIYIQIYGYEELSQ